MWFNFWPLCMKSMSSERKPQCDQPQSLVLIFSYLVIMTYILHIYNLPVIWFCNASKSFVSCSIPQLQFDRRTIGHFKHPCKKIHTNCRVWYFKKWTVCKTSQQRTLTHSRVPNQNDSELVLKKGIYRKKK